MEGSKMNILLCCDFFHCNYFNKYMDGPVKERTTFLLRSSSTTALYAWRRQGCCRLCLLLHCNNFSATLPQKFFN